MNETGAESGLYYRETVQRNTGDQILQTPKKSDISAFQLALSPATKVNSVVDTSLVDNNLRPFKPQVSRSLEPTPVIKNSTVAGAGKSSSYGQYYNPDRDSFDTDIYPDSKSIPGEFSAALTQLLQAFSAVSGTRGEGVGEWQDLQNDWIEHTQNNKDLEFPEGSYEEIAEYTRDQIKLEMEAALEFQARLTDIHMNISVADGLMSWLKTLAMKIVNMARDIVRDTR